MPWASLRPPLGIHDTAVDSSDVQADISTTSFSDAVQSLHMQRAYVKANGCLHYSRWCGGEGVGLNGARQGAHTPLKRTFLARDSMLSALCAVVRPSVRLTGGPVNKKPSCR